MVFSRRPECSENRSLWSSRDGGASLGGVVDFRPDGLACEPAAPAEAALAA